MSSAVKALDLLQHFSLARPEIGLTQLCRLANRDKATTYRHLQSLETAGFVERNPVSRHYRLGPAILHLAQTRELTVPRKAGAQSALHALAEATGESAHVSVLSGQTLHRLMARESPRHSTRVVIDIETFPLHATASGLCALAFGPEILFDAALANLTAFTAQTITGPDALRAASDATRASGFGTADGTFESDVHSLAAPLFDQTGTFAGAVSVASVATRFNRELELIVKAQLIAAGCEITHNWGGSIPEYVELAWASASALSQEMVTTE